MIPRKHFIFFLIDTPTGNVYYRSSTGTTLLAPITAGSLDVTLKHAPADWLNTSLEFQRNNNYHGIIRTYSQPEDFRKDAAQMISELVLLGVGGETELTFASYVYNTQPAAGDPTYKLYTKGNLDLYNLTATLLEGLSVNMMDGGVMELFKNYESTVFEIPCDGSIPENIKVNCDGYLKEDTLFYSITPTSGINNTTGRINSLPLIYLNNLTENYGAVHGNESLEDLPNFSVFSDSANTPIYFDTQTDVYLKGTISIRKNGFGASYFNIWYTTNILTTSPVSLIPASSYYELDYNNKIVSFTIDQKITLQAYEKLFFAFTFFAGSSPGAAVGEIVFGDMQMKFISKPKNSRPWAITAYDAWKQLGKLMCQKASQAGSVVNYNFESDALANALNFVLTSGDALRASNDPLYQRYYSVNENQQTDFGPTAKMTPKQFLDSIRVPLFTAMAVNHDSNGFEQLFLTSLDKVYDSSTVNFSLGEVSSMKWAFSKEFRFTDLEIGYEPQTYDQVEGKYETNTKLEMKAPVKKGEQKKLSLVSNFRADITGIERLRIPKERGSNTSITRNDSDGSVFIIDTNRSSYIYDYFTGLFFSKVFNPDAPNETNLHFATDELYQKYDHDQTDGSYLQTNKDFSIFVFKEEGYSATENINFKLSGVINAQNSLPGNIESCTIKLWHNGNIIFQVTTNVVAVDTPIDAGGLGSGFGVDVNHLLQTGDCIYVSIETTSGCVAQINSLVLTIGTYFQTSGISINISSGTVLKLLSMPSITVGDDKIESNFQYFYYNSNSYYNNFDLTLGLNGYKEGSTDTFIFEFYINGQRQSNYIVINGSIPRQQFTITGPVINRNFTTGDIIFVTASRQVSGSSTLEVQLMTSTISLTSTQVKCYSLYRENYDVFQGLPNLAPSLTSPGAPYNIRLSPGRCRDKWMKYFNSCFLDKVTGPLKFQSLSKNQFLLTVKDGVTVKENSDKTLLNDGRLAYPIVATVNTNVSNSFAELCSSAINLHLHWTFMGHDFYGFANKLSQKPALNEPQTWELLLSPQCDLSILAKINSFKLPEMQNNSISYSKLSPIQWVPYNRQAVSKYHTRGRDEFLFREQLGTWREKQNYIQPVQIGDPLPIQIYSKGADPVAYTVYRCDGSIYSGPTNLNTINSPAVPQNITDPIVLWQTVIDTTNFPRGNYYIVLSAALQNVAISELLGVRPADELDGTVLLEAWHTENTFSEVFDGDSPYRISMRVWGGFDNRFKQKFIASKYQNQPRDVLQLRAILYETTNFFLGRGHGVPDNVAKKVLAYMLMDHFSADGERFALEGTEWETQTINGVPMKYHTIEMTPAENRTNVNIALPGVIDTDNSMVVLINQQTLGPNVTNQSGTTETDLIEITINN